MMRHVFILNFFRLYNMIWSIALPMLKKSRRLAPGFEKRTDGRHHTRADIWIQAASAGEAYLAVRIVKHLVPAEPVRILVTTITVQGMEILSRHLLGENIHPDISLKLEWFPFDKQKTIEAAVQKINPAVMVLLETELWPGLLYALKTNRTRILIANARLSKGSFRGYRFTRFLWNHLSPDIIMATSGRDAGRYNTIFPDSRVSVMSNIKFETIKKEKTVPAAIRDLEQILPADLPVTILASVRRQEEKQIKLLVQKLLDLFPGQVIALFPRHMHRIDAWQKHLEKMEVPFCLKSRTTTAPAAGSVILWDTFGELKAAYALADAVFMGGSLLPLGGQNFLEPILQGTPTVTGPFNDDFAWAGKDIFNTPLVEKKENLTQIAGALIKNLSDPGNRKHRIRTAEGYMQSRKGGTGQVCRQILALLSP